MQYQPPYLPVDVDRWSLDRAKVNAAATIARLCHVPLARARTATSALRAVGLLAGEREAEGVELGELLEA